MFWTSIAYDYYKAFVTAFIEVDGTPVGLFGKPPLKIIKPIVNALCIFEVVIYILTTIFYLIQNATGTSPYLVFAPFILFFFIYLLGMSVIYLAFCFYMFKYVPSLKWIIVLCIVLPIGALNLILCFGGPLLACILIPLIYTPGVLQTPKLMDGMLPLILSLAGALLKCFVRPSDDDENPYAQTVPSLAGTIVYTLWFVFLAWFLLFFTARIDNSLGVIKWEITFLNPNWAIVAVPLWLGQIMVIFFFLIKAIREIALMRKHNPNGDAHFNIIIYFGWIFVITWLFIPEVLAVVRLDQLFAGRKSRPANSSSDIHAAVPLVLLLIDELVLLALTIVPFVVKKQVEEGKRRFWQGEMLTAI